MSTRDIILALSIRGRSQPFPLYKVDPPDESHYDTSPAEDRDPPGLHYDNLLRAIRDAPTKERECISRAIQLVEIEESARATLNAIGEKLDDPLNFTSWNPDPYHQKRLREPGQDLHEPDAFFSRHAKTRARVILRLSSKEILTRVRRLSHPLRLKLIDIFESQHLHPQIDAWIERYDRSLQFATEAPRLGKGQGTPQDQVQRKRHQGKQSVDL
jgi:hypothetical protein